MPKINIEIYRDKPPKPTDEGAAPDIVYPTKLNPEEDALFPFELKFFDAYTKKVDNAWENLDCTTPVEELLTSDPQEHFSERPFAFSPRTTTVKMLGSDDSKCPATLISTEFSDANDKRWERKPFATRPIEWRYEGNRWNIGGTCILINTETGQQSLSSDFSFFNPKVELKTSFESEEPLALIDPDLYHEQKAKKLKMKFAHHEETIQPLIYRGNVGNRKFGIKVSENSRSWAHYVSTGGKYAFSWIDSIYFCPFDTTDVANFKITAQPSYQADSVSEDGKFLTNKKYELHWVPRRIGYLMHYTHISKDDATLKVKTFSDLSAAAAGGFYKYNNTNDQITHVTITGTIPNVSINAYGRIVTHYVGFFWGRLPCNFSPYWPNIETVLGLTSPIRFFDTSGTYLYTVDHIWCPNNVMVKQYLTDASYPANDIQNAYSGGNGGDFHIHSDSSTTAFIKLAVVGSNVYCTLDQIRSTGICGCVDTPASLSYQYYGTIPSLNSPNWGFEGIWNYLASCKLWTEHLNPLREDAISLTDACSSSRISCIPFGIGISPSMEGDLVGIIRAGSKAFFVWRKTDEDITEHTLSYDSPSPILNYCGFETRRADGKLEHFSQGGYKYSWFSGAAYYEEDFLYDACYADQFQLEEDGRKIIGIGRDITVEESTDNYANYSGFKQYFGATSADADIMLDAPIYLMSSKERAIASIDWSQAVRGSMGQHVGANYNLRYRVARSNECTEEDFDIRNAF